MRNSIEEDIKIVENYLANSAMNEIDSNFFKNSGWETVDLEIPKSMQHILSDYKRVLKENEELKRLVAQKNGYTKKLEEDLFENCSNYVIPVQKVKDKIEEYKKMLLSCNRFSDVDRIKAISERILELQELLEGRK
ncbi:MAG: hypothetical protein V8R81_08670 [Clostridia bacterium]|jgi:trehalose-6-phosphate synthase